ncbi:MAG: RNA polymerase-binding protein DksA [Myxococcales bacterium]|jgi:DnaK suppressor protein
MNKTKLRRYRSLLNAQLSALLANNDETIDRLEDESLSHADPNDRASAESERNFDLRLRDRDRKLIGKIREALKRIEAGTFGVCDDCGLDIDERRLSARPVTTQCIECKEDEERRERRERLILASEAATPAPAARTASRRR